MSGDLPGGSLNRIGLLGPAEEFTGEALVRRRAISLANGSAAGRIDGKSSTLNRLWQATSAISSPVR